MDFLEAVLEYDYQFTRYNQMVYGAVKNRISEFCTNVYFNKKKIDKKDFFLLNKNRYSFKKYEPPKPTSDVKQQIFRTFTLFNYQDLLEEALMEPFSWYNSNIYPKNFDV